MLPGEARLLALALRAEPRIRFADNSDSRVQLCEAIGTTRRKGGPTVYARLATQFTIRVDINPPVCPLRVAAKKISHEYDARTLHAPLLNATALATTDCIRVVNLDRLLSCRHCIRHVHECHQSH